MSTEAKTEDGETRPQILVVEDDLGVVEGLLRGLRRAGFDVTVAMAGDEGLALALDPRFDAVVLDLMLPERDGFEILEAMRGRMSTPVVVLSARTELPSVLRAFDSGAVDFVGKPFWMEELVARLRSRLALRDAGPRRTVEFADLVVDLDGRVVRRGDEELALTPHEFNILACLTERAGRALTRPQIADMALAEGEEHSDRTVDSHVSRLRRKLGPAAAACVETVWGIGYRFRARPPA